MALVEGGSIVNGERQVPDNPRASEIFVNKFMEQSPYRDLDIENSKRVEIDNLPAWILGDPKEARVIPAWFAEELGGGDSLKLPIQAMVRVKSDGRLGIGLVIAGTMYEGGGQSYDKALDATDAATRLLNLFCEEVASNKEWEAKRHDRTDEEKAAKSTAQQYVSEQTDAKQRISELIEAAIQSIETRQSEEHAAIQRASDN